MAATRPLSEEALPSEELAIPSELPETRPSRLGKLAQKLKRRNVPKAPESPPPLIVEQLAAFESSEKTPVAEAKEVGQEAVPLEVTIEEVDEAEEARRQVEEVYDESETDDLPQEARYERRAEIKKDQAADDDGLATSIGQILADLHQKTAAAHAAFGRSRAKRSWKKHVAFVARQPAMYKQAVLAGFAGASIILIVVVLFQRN